MLAGAGDSDAEGSDGDGLADALAGIDLSTPLRDDEVLPAQQHRRVNDPAALSGGATKGKGRARNLHAAVAGEEAAPKKASKKAADKEDKKGDKKEKKGEEKGEKKAEKGKFVVCSPAFHRVAISSIDHISIIDFAVIVAAVQLLSSV